MDRKAKILADADDQLIAGLDKVQQRLVKKIVEALKRFDQSDGKLTKSGLSTIKLMRRLESLIIQALKDTGYQTLYSQYLTKFDAIATLTQNQLQATIGTKLPSVVVNAAKKSLVDRISYNLFKPQGVANNVVNPIKNILFRNISGGISYEAAVTEVTNYIAGTGGNGLLQRQATQVARDAINQYSGAIQQIAVDEFELTGFRYVGSLIKTSRESCTMLVDGSGAMAQFERKGMYRISDLPAIINILKNYPGWNPQTTVTNFFELRGGFNCRHEAIPFRLLKKDLALWE